MLVGVWLLLGVAAALAVLVVIGLAFAAVVVHTARLLLAPPLRLLARASGYLRWRGHRRLPLSG